jgi:hypothetical protein
MNAANHSPGCRVADEAAPGESRNVTIDGVRQVFRVSGEAPSCRVHFGGPGAQPEYPRIPGLESRLTLVYGRDLTEAATKEVSSFAQRWPDRPEAAEAGRGWDAASKKADESAAVLALVSDHEVVNPA